MSITRVSSSFIINQGVHAIQGNLSALTRLQNRISAGKNIFLPSDDPINTSSLLRINQEANLDDRFKRNIDEALGEMEATNVALTSIVEITHRAREIAVQAANGTNGPEQYAAFKREVDGLLNQLVALGNSSYAGRQIFSGFLTDTPAFTTSGQDIIYNGTPNTAQFERRVQISQASTIAINLNGDDVLGNVAVAGGVATGSGLFYVLTKLNLDIQNNDATSINANIDLITTEQARILGHVGTIGERTKQLEMAKSRIEDRTILQAKQTNNIQELDMPKAISDLNYRQTLYQASLSSMSKLLETSLLSFLR